METSTAENGFLPDVNLVFACYPSPEHRTSMKCAPATNDDVNGLPRNKRAHSVLVLPRTDVADHAADALVHSTPPPRDSAPPSSRSMSLSLRKRIVKTKICAHNLRGRCCRGARCSFAHSIDELREPPDLYKTRLCVNYKTNGVCIKGAECRFAHGEAQLRWTPEFYRTSLCPHYGANAVCTAGKRCRWAHGTAELRDKPPVPAAGGGPPEQQESPTRTPPPKETAFMREEIQIEHRRRLLAQEQLRLDLRLDLRLLELQRCRQKQHVDKNSPLQYESRLPATMTTIDGGRMQNAGGYSSPSASLFTRRASTPSYLEFPSRRGGRDRTDTASERGADRRFSDAYGSSAGIAHLGSLLKEPQYYRAAVAAAVAAAGTEDLSTFASSTLLGSSDSMGSVARLDSGVSGLGSNIVATTVESTPGLGVLPPPPPPPLPRDPSSPGTTAKSPLPAEQQKAPQQQQPNWASLLACVAPGNDTTGDNEGLSPAAVTAEDEDVITSRFRDAAESFLQKHGTASHDDAEVQNLLLSILTE